MQTSSTFPEKAGAAGAAAAAGAGAARLQAATPLTGGAIQENWLLEVAFEGGVLVSIESLGYGYREK